MRRYQPKPRTTHSFCRGTKYFGAGRGITYYNLVSDQFTGLNAVVVPGTLRDSLLILGLLL